MKKILTGLAILIMAIVFSAASVMYQRSRAERCAYDGTVIVPVYEVDITLSEDRILKFCSIHCAKEWSRKNLSAIDSVTVTDEVTGERLDASMAYFVESDVVSVKATDNRVHVFKHEDHALSHVTQHKGKMLENPF